VLALLDGCARKLAIGPGNMDKTALWEVPTPVYVGGLLFHTYVLCLYIKIHQLHLHGRRNNIFCLVDGSSTGSFRLLISVYEAAL
jgi:hypothetical protein